MRDEIKTIKETQSELVKLVKQALGMPVAPQQKEQKPKVEQRLFTENIVTDMGESHLVMKSENNLADANQFQGQRMETEEGLLVEGTFFLVNLFLN